VNRSMDHKKNAMDVKCRLAILSRQENLEEGQ